MWLMPDILVLTTFLLTCGPKIWSDNAAERLNCGICRRSDAVGIFPTRESIVYPGRRRAS